MQSIRKRKALTRYEGGEVKPVQQELRIKDLQRKVDHEQLASAAKSTSTPAGKAAPAETSSTTQRTLDFSTQLSAQGTQTDPLNTEDLSSLAPSTPLPAVPAHTKAALTSASTQTPTPPDAPPLKAWAAADVEGGAATTAEYSLAGSEAGSGSKKGVIRGRRRSSSSSVDSKGGLSIARVVTPQESAWTHVHTTPLFEGGMSEDEQGDGQVCVSVCVCA